MNDYNLLTEFKIFDTTEHVFITISDDTDLGEGFININTNDKDSQTWFGKNDMTISKAQAKMMAQALLKLAGE